MHTRHLWPFALLVLTACGGTGAGTGSDPVLTSRFATPDDAGNFDIGLGSFEEIRFSTNGTEGIAHVVGQTAQGDLVAAAGLLPGTDSQSWPGVGTATYAGVYSMGIISAGAPGQSEFATDQIGGAISLTADFAANSLTGQSVDQQTGTIPDGILTVEGTMNGRFMDGTVTVAPDGRPSVTGTLDGRAGGDEAYGVFHATGADFAIAGGFNATRQ